MEKLLQRWRESPSTLLHARIIAYHRKHPFAECFLSEADLKTLRSLTAFDCHSA